MFFRRDGVTAQSGALTAPRQCNLAVVTSHRGLWARRTTVREGLGLVVGMILFAVGAVAMAIWLFVKRRSVPATD